MDGYKKVKMLGKGTFGLVYLCVRTRTERKVVLKEINVNLNNAGMQVAKNEIKILKCLKHPNIIQYYTHFISTKFIYIIMEYAIKGNLHEMITRRRQHNTYISQQVVLNIFCQIVLGVDYIHSKQIIHRDLKCENILITGTKDDVIKIADFGISKLLESNGQTNTVIGTPNYLAPEICDEKPYNIKSDIWSMGCILFELCALERMFDGSIANVVMAIANGNIKQINFGIYDSNIQNIINLTLTTNPDLRPNTKDLMRHPLLMSVIFNILVNLGRIIF